MLPLIILPGYKLSEVIHEGINTIIYRGESLLEQQAVIIKVIKADYPSLNAIANLKHEYKIIENLDLEGIVKALKMETHQNRLALVFEDFGGQSLKQYLVNHKLELINFLDIAIQLAQALLLLHSNHIIHKDIKPANIIINPQTQQVKLTDFSIASLLSKEIPSLCNPNQLQGTLAYMSPEQTGRMNRSLDYRSDFYSLGVTFYEMLTQQLPFVSNDLLEIVHCHIAKQPPDIEQLNSEIPQAVVSIVKKLMAKNAEDRYQTAKGLIADLKICREQWITNREIIDFTPGSLDVLSQLLIPQKLYGREAEVNMLLEAFERISEGKSELVLVSGYSGIGKSSVVNEVNRPITRQKGYFISGKFDQFQRNIPYASLIQAFNFLMRQLLTENTTQLQEWRSKILEAVGANGQVIIDIIPELELIIGKQPEIPQIGATESRHRFNLVFLEFIRVFCKKEHPLVIFFDDLQWADSATLKLIQLLITDPLSKYLLILGAYRDNEVNSTHPLIIAIEEIKKSNPVVNNIVLKPLSLVKTIELVAETLNDCTDRVKHLAELIFNKTAGNPFFLTQLIQSLYQVGCLKFDFITSSWSWNFEEILAIGITDKSVVELVVGRIQQLPESTQKVLKMAACVGDKCNLDALSIINEKSPSVTANELYPALQSGLILPLNETYKIPLLFDKDIETLYANSLEYPINNLKSTMAGINYKFLHDRVQQAAYSLIPESEKHITHLKIGQLLLKQTPDELLTENILDIVNQLNIGVELISDQEEKYQLAQLNLMAGEKTKSATAYEAAAKYLSMGLGLMTEEAWLNKYELMLNLHIKAAELEYLNGNFDKSKNLGDLTLEKANNILDQMRIYTIQIQSLIAQNLMIPALEASIKSLTILGVRMQKKPTLLDFLVAIIQTKLTLWGKRIEDLVYLPEIKDVSKLVAMQILTTMAPAASMVDSLHFPLGILAIVRLSIRYGNSVFAASGYSLYGAMLCDKFGDIEGGYQFGKLGLSVLENKNANSIKCRVYFVFNAFIRHFKEPIQSTIKPLIEAVQSGLESGDLDGVSYSSWTLNNNLFLSGENLDVVEQKLIEYADLMQRLNLQSAYFIIKAIKQMVLNLQGNCLNKYELIGSDFDEAKILEIAGNNTSWLSVFYYCKTVINYFFGDYAAAIETAGITEKNHGSNPGFLIYFISNFYHSLALLANFKNVSPSQKRQYLEIVNANQKKMKKLADHAPFNFQNKYELVEAEKARVTGQDVKAMHLYNHAITLAQKHGFMQEKALSYELAARFYLAQGQENIAKTYMTEAYYDYIYWGALAKTKDLDENYPNLIIRSTILAQLSKDDTIKFSSSLTHNSITTTNSSNSLDLASLIKVMQAITSEILLENLLIKFMKIIIENAAAEKGCLILLKDNQMFIEAIDNGEDDSVLLQSIPVEKSQYIPISIVNYVARTNEYLVLNDATQEVIFEQDSYILHHQPKSVLCAPILYKGKLMGIIYLENNQCNGAFTRDRLEILKLLTSQAAISIENAYLYNREQEKSEQLQQSLKKLQRTQAQLVQTEKISSLGQLVAGVAHEVNNPVGFIQGNLRHTHQYLQDLTQLVRLYQNYVSSPPPDIAEYLEEIDLDFLIEDFLKMNSSMEIGIERIRNIMQSLRNFSRIDSDDKKLVDIHEGLETTLMILQHRLKANPERPAIQIIKQYGKLPLVKCYPSQLNQVFMNLLANGIDALEESNYGKTFAEIVNNPNLITIYTAMDDDYIIIRISDNGPGITEEVKNSIFNPFFTTKPEGKGTGLGLSISHQIVTEKHGGTIECISLLGKGTEFLIKLPLL